MCNNLKFSRHDGKVCLLLYAKNLISCRYMNRESLNSDYFC